MELHDARIAGRQNHRRRGASLGANGPEQIDRLGALIMIEVGTGTIT